MIKNIAIVGGSEPNCGIFYYGDNAYNILKNSKKYNFYHIPVSSYFEFLQKTENMDLIIYNWHITPMPWCTTEVFLKIKKPQFLLHGHTSQEQLIAFDGIDEFIAVDPSRPTGPKFHAGIRPITYYPDIEYSPPSGVLKIGTSGFGHGGKNIDTILQVINHQFDEPVIFNVHASVGTFTDETLNTLTHKLAMLKSQAKPNVTVNFTTERMSDYDNVKWLNNNDINMYIYPHYNCQGVSGCIDKALAAKKPIGVNSSNFFKHIRSDEINLEITPIKAIIQRGIAPVEKFYDMWNPANMVKQYEDILDNFYELH
jgi:hypothetical protein